jgi:2,5-diketo-D-gluconate reductase B
VAQGERVAQGEARVTAVKAAGATIPAIGLGTWQLRGETCAVMVAEALRLGYTHVDTAQGYSNEDAVGDGLAASGVARGTFFLTTKVRTDKMADGELQRSVEESLRKLRVDHVDLLLLHWPNPLIPLADSIRALNQVKREGLTKHIGLSNFTMARLDEAWRLTTEPFAAEQIEYHPYLEQTKMLAALRAREMAIIAYCPIALGRVVGDPVIEAIARAHRRSAAQVTLRWIVQQGLVAIPKTSKVERLSENLAIFDFALSEAEMAQMSALARPGSRLVNEPQWVPEWD